MLCCVLFFNKGINSKIGKVIIIGMKIIFVVMGLMVLILGVVIVIYQVGDELYVWVVFGLNMRKALVLQFEVIVVILFGVVVIFCSNKIINEY